MCNTPTEAINMETVTTPDGSLTWTVSDIALNVLTTYANSTPHEKRAGREWYPRARADVADVADVFGLDTRTVAAVVAVTSPLLYWDLNIAVATDAIRAHRAGAPFESVPCLNNSARRAFLALDGDMSDVLRSRKVAAFYHCIIGDRGHVCVDRHAYTAAMHYPGANASMTKRRYGIIADGYRAAARDLHMRVSTLQAITWLTVRNGWLPVEAG